MSACRFEPRLSGHKSSKHALTEIARQAMRRRSRTGVPTSRDAPQQIATCRTTELRRFGRPHGSGPREGIVQQSKAVASCRGRAPSSPCHSAVHGTRCSTAGPATPSSVSREMQAMPSGQVSDQLVWPPIVDSSTIRTAAQQAPTVEAIGWLRHRSLWSRPPLLDKFV